MNHAACDSYNQLPSQNISPYHHTTKIFAGTIHTVWAPHNLLYRCTLTREGTQLTKQDLSTFPTQVCEARFLRRTLLGSVVKFPQQFYSWKGFIHKSGFTRLHRTFAKIFISILSLPPLGQTFRFRRRDTCSRLYSEGRYSYIRPTRLSVFSAATTDTCSKKRRTTRCFLNKLCYVRTCNPTFRAQNKQHPAYPPDKCPSTPSEINTNI